MHRFSSVTVCFSPPRPWPWSVSCPSCPSGVAPSLAWTLGSLQPEEWHKQILYMARCLQSAKWHEISIHDFKVFHWSSVKSVSEYRIDCLIGQYWTSFSRPGLCGDVFVMDMGKWQPLAHTFRITCGLCDFKWGTFEKFGHGSNTIVIDCWNFHQCVCRLEQQANISAHISVLNMLTF